MSSHPSPPLILIVWYIKLGFLRAQDLCHWVEQLPTEYITFLIDCHLSHVVRFGKNEEVCVTVPDIGVER